MNRYGKLINNSFIFAVGSLGSKIISILLVPLYTFVLSSDEYGTVDLVTSIMSLLLPFVTLTVEQGLLRFVIDSKDKDEINTFLSTSFYLCLITLSFLLLICFIVYFCDIYTGALIFYFYLLMFFFVTQVLFSTHLRAIGESKKYAFSGIFQVIVLCVSNVVFLVLFKMGINGYLISLILSFAFNSLLCIYFLKDTRLLPITIDKSKLHRLLIYSIPLIPNFSMWWLVNNSTRYVVLTFLGLSENGIFAVASKIPTVINVFVSIFQQAWQISAYEEFESKDRSKYYSNVFKHYYQFLFLSASALMVFNKVIFMYFVGNEFSSAWQAVPFLILGVLYQTFSSFLGTIYTANFKTKEVFTTSFIGAVIAIISSYFLIPLWGLSASGLGASLGFFSMWLLRLFGTRRIIYIKFSYINFSLFNILYLSQIFALFYFSTYTLLTVVLIQAVFLIFMLLLSWEMIKTIFVVLKSKVSKTK